MRSVTLVVLGLILTFFFTGILAQDNNAGVNVGAGGFDFDITTEEETAKVVASPDALTATVFPLYNDGKFPAGSEVEVLMGFRNKGQKTFNVTYAEASFNYPLDFSYYIQNFTARRYGLVVRPNEEVTLSYSFTPDPMLEMRDFGLVLSLHYVEQSSDPSVVAANFTSVLYNATVDVTEAESSFDAQSFFAYVAILAVLGLISYILYRNLSSWTKQQKRGSTKGSERVNAGESTTIDNDWLTGTAADPTLNKRKARITRSG